MCFTIFLQQTNALSQPTVMQAPADFRAPSPPIKSYSQCPRWRRKQRQDRQQIAKMEKLRNNLVNHSKKRDNSCIFLAENWFPILQSQALLKTQKLSKTSSHTSYQSKGSKHERQYFLTQKFRCKPHKAGNFLCFLAHVKQVYAKSATRNLPYTIPNPLIL